MASSLSGTYSIADGLRRLCGRERAGNDKYMKNREFIGKPESQLSDEQFAELNRAMVTLLEILPQIR